MPSIGIVVAVSDYTGDAGKLPACSRDGAAIAKILSTDSKFDEVLFIDKDTSSSNVKNKLTEFLTKYKGKEVDDVVFYFSGHGEFIGDEFYYLMSDYQTRRRKQTSLENTELDSLVRVLNPKVFIKIVDACQSGVSYFKSPDEFSDYLKSANSKFKNLYFLFSSQSDQASWQDNFLSSFTESIINSITSHPVGKIRYKDIIDYVSDEFSTGGNQTPFFVTQADFTEIFCEVSETLKSELSKYIRGTVSVLPSTIQGGKSKSRMDIVKKEAALYCKEDFALDILNRLPEKISVYKFNTETSDLYDLNVKQMAGEDVPNAQLIGRMLGSSKDSSIYFAEPKTETRIVDRKVPKAGTLGLSILNMGRLGESRDANDYINVPESKTFTVGYKNTVDLPYDFIQVRAEPKFDNINLIKCFIVPLISRTKIRLYWYYAHYDYVTWTRVSLVSKTDWSTAEAYMKKEEDVTALLNQIMHAFFAYIEENLEAHFGPASDGMQEVAVEAKPEPAVVRGPGRTGSKATQ